MKIIDNGTAHYNRVSRANSIRRAIKSKQRVKIDGKLATRKQLASQRLARRKDLKNSGRKHTGMSAAIYSVSAKLNRVGRLKKVTNWKRKQNIEKTHGNTLSQMRKHVYYKQGDKSGKGYHQGQTPGQLIRGKKGGFYKLVNGKKIYQPKPGMGKMKKGKR